MLTISKPLSSGQAQAYHKEEFANARDNYYSEGDRVRGEWHGKLAERWGLKGEVNEEHFARLADGQHPLTGAQLVQHRAAMQYVDDRGEKITTMEHRAGWDATFSAPKSVSLTALVGGDERVRAAHRESVNVALDELEKYVQARIGGNHPAETTGKWIAAKFEHDSSRPVEGYAAPQLHTHVVFFNMTEREPAKCVPCNRENCTAHSSTPPPYTVRSWHFVWGPLVTKLSRASMARLKFGATRKNILRPAARAASKSKTT
jgi:conjugative relaxase-like TrwC/TraI family protein